MSKKIINKKKSEIAGTTSIALNKELDAEVIYDNEKTMSHNFHVPDFNVYLKDCKTKEDYDKVFKHCQKYFLVMYKEIDKIAANLGEVEGMLKAIYEHKKASNCDSVQDNYSDTISENDEENSTGETGSNHSKGATVNVDVCDQEENNEEDENDEPVEVVQPEKKIVTKKILVKKSEESVGKVAPKQTTIKKQAVEPPKTIQKIQKKVVADIKKTEEKEDINKKPKKKA